MEIARGDIVIVAVKGSYTGKPRPALVVQADLFNQTHASITVCPITADCIDASLFRIAVPPGPTTGLSQVSQIMVDKVLSVPRSAISRRIGRCSPPPFDQVADALRLWLDL